MLVNIYGSKELFANEYRTQLAERLLSRLDYNTESEVKYLELLKLSFGESQLNLCEVMLKDITDSKRINSNIKDREKKRRENNEGNTEKSDNVFKIDTLILSGQFWPSFREEKLELPSSIKTVLDKYTKAFQALKGNRTLTWKTHLGKIF